MKLKSSRKDICAFFFFKVPSGYHSAWYTVSALYVFLCISLKNMYFSFSSFWDRPRIYYQLHNFKLSGKVYLKYKFYLYILLTLCCKEVVSDVLLCCILDTCCYSKSVLQCSFYKLLKKNVEIRILSRHFKNWTYYLEIWWTICLHVWRHSVMVVASIK